MTGWPGAAPRKLLPTDPNHEIWRQDRIVAGNCAVCPFQGTLIVAGEQAMLRKLCQGRRVIRARLKDALQEVFRLDRISKHALVDCEIDHGLKIIGIKLGNHPVGMS
jgi:hypothetical protein